LVADWSEDPEFAPVPPWLREAVDAAFADLQRPAPVEVLLGWDPGEAILWVSEVNESGQSGFEAQHDMRGAALVVALSDWLQEQFFPETRGAWGQARPECPGHAHPPEAAEVQGRPWWVCPDDGRRIAVIGDAASSSAPLKGSGSKW